MDRWLTVNFVVPIRGLLPCSGSRQNIPILMYHAITDDPEPGVHGYYRLNTSPALLREHLRILKHEGFTVVDLATAASVLGSISRRPNSVFGKERLAAARERQSIIHRPIPKGKELRMKAAKQESSKHSSFSGEESTGENEPPPSFNLPPAAKQSSNLESAPVRMAVITFDDGFHDFLGAAWPALREHGFTPTVFLPTAFIGRDHRSFKGRKCLSWGEIRELHREGVHFGSHTISHPKLWELHQPALEHELADSRRAIEQELCGTVDAFSHPYAFPQSDEGYVKRFRDAMERAGYRVGVTTTLGCAAPGDDLFTLKRLPANGADDPILYRAKLQGAYDWLGLPQRIVKRFKRLITPEAFPPLDP